MKRKVHVLCDSTQIKTRYSLRTSRCRARLAALGHTNARYPEHRISTPFSPDLVFWICAVSKPGRCTTSVIFCFSLWLDAIDVRPFAFSIKMMQAVRAASSSAQITACLAGCSIRRPLLSVLAWAFAACRHQQRWQH